MFEQLAYRRQFLISKAPLPDLGGWQRVAIGPHHLHAHPDLEINHVSDAGKAIALIGCLFDADDPEKGNREILEDILNSSESFDEFLSTIKRYAGRYALMYHSQERCALVHDALALREVYYCASDNLIVCGSQPNLVAEYSSPKISRTKDSAVLEFYENELKNGNWVGDDTCFEHVKHLLPNHYLDVGQRKSRRYWPNAIIESVPLDEAVSRSCKFLQGMLKASAKRHPLMLAVTSGTDSRTMLAASRGVAEKIYYFVNKERQLTEQSPDIRIPRQIFDRLGLPFHVHNVAGEVDEKFRKIFLQNTFFASERILPTIYNVYFKEHPEKLNILGIGEIGRTRYGKQPRRLSAFRMAYTLGYKDSAYAVKVCQQILPELESVAKKFRVNAMTLLYWEQTMGNWGAVGNSESDIAIEEFDPCDSHYLYETFLGVDARYTTYAKNILFNEMIKTMWPELLSWPINPPRNTLQDHVRYFAKQTGLYSFLKNAKYRAHFFRYCCLPRKRPRSAA